MTPKVIQNFQQGWLDLVRRQGVAAAIAVYLVWQTSASLPRKFETLTDTVYAHSAESDKKMDELIALMGVIVKGQETDRAFQRQQIRLQQLTCLRVSHNDSQKDECVR